MKPLGNVTHWTLLKSMTAKNIMSDDYYNPRKANFSTFPGTNYGLKLTFCVWSEKIFCAEVFTELQVIKEIYRYPRTNLEENILCSNHHLITQLVRGLQNDTTGISTILTSAQFSFKYITGSCRHLKNCITSTSRSSVESTLTDNLKERKDTTASCVRQ